MTEIKYVIQLIRSVHDRQEYNSHCAIGYYDHPLLFTSISEVYQWLAMNGYRQDSQRGKNIYSKQRFGTSKEITSDGKPVPTTYTAILLKVNPDRTQGNYQQLDICGHLE